MDTLRQDLRSALLTMRRAPGFAATALVTLALGIGATTAVFSIVHGVLLRPLPYRDGDRLVRVWEEHPGGASPAGNRWLSRSTYATWRAHTETVDALGGYGVFERQLAFGGKRAKSLGAQVSPAVLATLGVAPALGRLFIDDDDRRHAPRVALLSDGLWRERYAASPAAIGATVLVDDEPHTIVGVAPPGFGFPDPRVQFWTPYVIPQAAAEPEGAIVFTALARLKPGASIAQVQAEGTAAARAAPRHRLTELFFGRGGPVVVHARPLVEDMTARARPALSVLAVAVTLVLVIACANVTNLLLSRGVARRRELAIRTALGGTPIRIARQLFTENLVFAMAGGAAGLLLAWWLVRILPAYAPAGLPRVDAIALDANVLLFWGLATLLSAVAAGIAPALRAASLDLAGACRSVDGSSGAGCRGTSGRRLRNTLLVLQAAFAVLLIVGAGLLARSFVRLVHVDNGYTADGVLIAAVELPRGTSDARIDEFITAALARVRALPGVTRAGAAAMIPLTTRTAVMPFRLPASLTGGKPTAGRALVYWITPDYAEALGLRLRQGRFFAAPDARSATLPAIVNEEFVRMHLAPGPVVGRIVPGFVGPEPGRPAEIVGVVANVLKDGNDRAPQPEVYFLHGPGGQRIGSLVYLVIRTSVEPASLAGTVRGLARALEPGAIVDRVEPMTTIVEASFAPARFAVAVFMGFASLAMALAAVGLYGVLSYDVSQRLRELAVRAALGARRADLVRLVLREGVSPAGAGIAVGLTGAALLTRYMRDLLFGVTALDPVTFAIAPVLLATVAVAACLGPALRAATADPVTTLRAQ